MGVSNAEVAKCAKAPVLIVGKCGVGAAIDRYTLNSSFFESKGVPVLGIYIYIFYLYNFLSEEETGDSKWHLLPLDQEQFSTAATEKGSTATTRARRPLASGLPQHGVSKCLESCPNSRL